MTGRDIVLIACLVLSLNGIVHGGSCPEPVGHWGYGPNRASVWFGEFALISSGPKLLAVDFRLGAPQSIIGELRLPGHAIAMAVEGDVLYAGLRTSQGSDALLVAVDLGDPSDPRLLGHLAIAAALSDVAVQGDIAYVASLSEGLVLVDVSDPLKLARLSVLPGDLQPQSVVVRNAFAYMGNHDGLIVADVTDPTRPSVVFRQTIEGSDADLALSDGFLHFLTSEVMTVFDLASPAQPVRRGSFATAGFAQWLDVKEETAFITDNQAIQPLVIVDVSDPGAPRQIGAYDPGDIAYQVAATDGAVLLSLDALGSQLIDTTNPTSPQLLAELPPPAPPGDIADVEVHNGLAFLADTGGLFRPSPPFGRLRIVDVSGSSGFAEVGSLGFPTHAHRIAIYGDHVLVVRGEEDITPIELDVIDVSDPAEPTVVGNLQFSGPLWGDITVSGDHAYLADSSLRVVDLSDPANPVLAGSTLHSGGYSSGLAVAGDRAYVAAIPQGFCVIDVSDPTNPNELSCTPTGRGARGVAVSGGTAFVSSNIDSPRPPWVGELKVFDITDDLTPVEIASLELWGSAGRVSIDDDLLFVEVMGRGLLVVDVSDPAEPTPIGLAPLNESGVGSDGRLYAVAGYEGLDIYDTGVCNAPAPSPEFLWSPENPVLGEEITFTDISTGSPTSWSWDFGDGTHSDEQNPHHSFDTPGRRSVTLTATNDAGSATTELWVPVGSLADPMRWSWIVPAAAHGDGKANTQWRTDLVLFSTRTDPSEAVLYLMKQGEDNTLRHGKQIQVPVGATAFDDVVASVFGEDAGSGAVFITSPIGMLASSRTFTLADEGTYGQHIPAVGFRESGHDGRQLIQLTQDEEYRTNLGLVNRLGTALSVDASLYSHDHTKIADTVYAVEPFGHLQVNEFIANLTDEPLSDGYLTLSGSPYSDFIAYASTIDNATGDPFFMLPPAVGTEPLWILAAAHVRGRNGTVWRTDLEVCATEAADVAYRIELFTSGQTSPVPPAETFSLSAGHCVRYADVVHEVFGVSATGALRIIPSNGVVLVTSRTYTKRSGGGTYGQFVPAILESEAIPWYEQRRIPQLSHSVDPTVGFRTNVGLVNAAAVPIEVKLDILASDNSLLSESDVELAPFEHRQLNRFLEGVVSGDLVNATVTVQSETSNAFFFAYASVVDNASGDAVFLPAQ